MSNFKIKFTTVKNAVNDKQIKASLTKGDTVYVTAQGWGRSLSTAQSEAAMRLEQLMKALLPFLNAEEKLTSPVESVAYKKSYKCFFIDLDKDPQLIKQNINAVACGTIEQLTGVAMERLDQISYKLAYDKLWVFKYKPFRKTWRYCSKLNVKNCDIGTDISNTNLIVFEYVRGQNVERGLLPDVE
jgi:hypothetical protein